ncbi:MAG: primosomal protein N' [Burkholderiales bacterium]|nr:MAG: primosomal protein N' [Burkholderiales bacterium]
MSFWPTVAVATPAHGGLAQTLSYRSESPLAPGTLVRVPLGSREVLGVVWTCTDVPPQDLEPAQARPIGAALEGLEPLNGRWRQLVQFAARYYQRSLGEVAMGALPPALRELDNTQLQRRLRRLATARAGTGNGSSGAPTPVNIPMVSTDQERALAALAQADRPVLLFGATGSGKTEVYLRATEQALAADAKAQVLVMVPEINLTPQLEARFRERFEAGFGAGALVCLHSGMTPPQRLQAWLAAHAGHARIVLGTRMAIFASLPGLRLIVVDEEHDPSYKSQEGARYSARDLAVYRARLETDASARCQVLLGSATPSLESWHAAAQGRYQRVDMPGRIGGGELPRLRLVDMNHQPKGALLAPALLAAMQTRIGRGEQCLVLLNRRGYAPVLSCGACDWKSSCPHCSAYRVFHKIDRTLRCHHCGFTQRVPRACPDCGNLDIVPVGRGTEQLEEQLGALLADVRRPDGSPVRVARMDADTTRAKGSLEAQLDALHAGEVDVLVGTQMVAKGHDFRRITLVASVNADAALFASDHRAPERLFALLMQAAGRAGRDARHSSASEMWVQTWHPQHPLFDALARHDYPGFATAQLADRQAAAMPPFGFQALLRADARSQQAAQAFLNGAAAAAAGLPGSDQVTLYPAVPLNIQRVANVERAQLLLESDSRPALQSFLAAWQPVLLQARSLPEARGLIRFAVDVDPLTV